MMFGKNEPPILLGHYQGPRASLGPLDGPTADASCGLQGPQAL
jgi:hypothetical protein